MFLRFHGSVCIAALIFGVDGAGGNVRLVPRRAFTEPLHEYTSPKTDMKPHSSSQEQLSGATLRRSQR